jgi:hypothetical protein
MSHDPMNTDLSLGEKIKVVTFPDDKLWIIKDAEDNLIFDGTPDPRSLLEAIASHTGLDIEYDERDKELPENEIANQVKKEMEVSIEDFEEAGAKDKNCENCDNPGTSEEQEEQEGDGRTLKVYVEPPEVEDDGEDYEDDDCD